MNDKISIIVPFYNRSNNFIDLYKTVINQTISNWELIIVDDNSQDSDILSTLISETNDHRVRFFSQKNNLGGAVARNKGIIESTGEYIAFLDSDDLWDNNKLEIQLSLIDKADVIFSGIRIVDENLNIIEEKNLNYISGSDISSYIFTNDGLVQTSSLFMKRDCAIEIMFNPNLRRHQDYDFVLRLYSAGFTFLKSNESLVYWIHNGDSVFSRGASYLRSSNWLRDYKQYFNDDSVIDYTSKILFWMARKDKSLIRFIFDIQSIFGFKKAFVIMMNIIKRVIGKMLR